MSLFNQLGNQTKNLEDLKAAVKTILPDGITPVMIDSLFSDYGF